MFEVAIRETGDILGTVATIEEAYDLVAEYEQEDKKEGMYEPTYYVVFDRREGVE